jgi:L,D-transpeptidase catalytic domain
MHAAMTNTRRRGALLVALSACALGVPAGAPASQGVLWHGRTPDQGTALVARVGKELRIELEAVGPSGSIVRIRAARPPRGTIIEPVLDSPSRVVFRWRPTVRQLGETRLIFTASDGAAAAPRLAVRVHVGRRATRTFRLSSARGTSQNATLLRPVAALARPDPRARVVARLPAATPELVPHVVYLLGGKIDRKGRYWLRVQLPKLPNGSSGWIPRGAVGPFRQVDTHLVIDRAHLRATLYKRGKVAFESIVGVGQPRWPTPAGRFYVRERLTGFSDPIYGALAFGTNARSAVLTDWPGGGFIGVHGTNQPEILPGRVSHGCVRLPNSSIRRLDRLIRVGTPVTIK